MCFTTTSCLQLNSECSDGNVYPQDACNDNLLDQQQRNQYLLGSDVYCLEHHETRTHTGAAPRLSEQGRDSLSQQMTRVKQNPPQLPAFFAPEMRNHSQRKATLPPETGLSLHMSKRDYYYTMAVPSRDDASEFTLLDTGRTTSCAQLTA